MISCWCIHHLDIAQRGNGTDETGPISIEGEATYPDKGGCDGVLTWKMRMEFANAAPITFVNQDNSGIGQGTRFFGENGWIHVVRGNIKASDDANALMNA